MLEIGVTGLVIIILLKGGLLAELLCVFDIDRAVNLWRWQLFRLIIILFDKYLKLVVFVWLDGGGVPINWNFGSILLDCASFVLGYNVLRVDAVVGDWDVAQFAHLLFGATLFCGRYLNLALVHEHVLVLWLTVWLLFDVLGLIFSHDFMRSLFGWDGILRGNGASRARYGGLAGRHGDTGAFITYFSGWVFGQLLINIEQFVYVDALWFLRKSVEMPVELWREPVAADDKLGVLSIPNLALVLELLPVTLPHLLLGGAGGGAPSLFAVVVNADRVLLGKPHHLN